MFEYDILLLDPLPASLTSTQWVVSDSDSDRNGRFYITFDDWSKFFTMAVICKDDGGTRRRKEKRCTWTALGRGLQWTALAKDEVEAKEQHESHWAPIGGLAMVSWQRFFVSGFT